jgi:hypothetical protein
MSWSEDHPAMLQRTGRAAAPASSDFPTESELRAALELDEICRAVNLVTRHDDREFAREVEHRLNAAFPTGAQKGRLS